MIKICKYHGEVNHAQRPDGGYRCTKCRSEHVTKTRRHILARLTEEAGGKCQICSYNKYKGALEFHHIDPALKEFVINLSSVKSYAKSKIEADKCILLCSNCHREVHAGVTSI